MSAGFIPYGFLRLGRSLAKAPFEARRRTGIGRLYYAVHLRARERLASKGVVVPKHMAHKAVIVELRHHGHPGANMVKRLKRLREQSDYNIQLNVTPADAQRALTLANHLWPLL